MLDGLPGLFEIGLRLTEVTPRNAGSPNGGTDLESCEYVTNRDVDYCCAHAPGASQCCESGNGRFKVLPENPQIWARWLDGAYDVVGTVIDIGDTSTVVSTSTSTSTSTTSSSSESESQSETQVTTTTAALPMNTSEGSVEHEEDGSETGLSTGAKAGIGVGAAIGAMLLIAVIWLGYKHHQHRKAQSAATPMDRGPAYGVHGYAQPPMHQEYYQQDGTLKTYYVPAQELPGHPEDHRRPELPS